VIAMLLVVIATTATVAAFLLVALVGGDLHPVEEEQ
jgi:hypothetical protein